MAEIQGTVLGSGGSGSVEVRGQLKRMTLGAGGTTVASNSYIDVSGVNTITFTLVIGSNSENYARVLADDAEIARYSSAGTYTLNISQYSNLQLHSQGKVNATNPEFLDIIYA